MNKKEAKNLIVELMEEEIKENGNTAEVVSLTKRANVIKVIYEGIQDYFYTAAEIIKSVKNNLNQTRYAEAVCDNINHEIKIFLDKIIKANNNDKNNALLELCISVYHEYQHLSLEKYLLEDELQDLTTLYLKIENLTNKSDGFYEKYHDCFYTEIMANTYGYKKAEEYLKEKYYNPKVYKALKSKIDLYKMLHEIYLKNYDVHPFMEKAHEGVQEFISETPLKRMYLGTGIEIIPLLYDEDGTFKSLNNLNKQDNWNKLPIEVKYLIVSSEVYLNDFNYKEASKEELQFLLDATNYALSLEKTKTEENSKIRQRLDSLSTKIKGTDAEENNIYMSTLVVLNRKSKINRDKKLKLIKQKETIINEKNNGKPKRRILSQNKK